MNSNNTESNSKRNILNRFTTIPFLMDMLIRKHLTLLNPASWEDKNDTIPMDLYKKKKKKESIYALCMTNKRETIHHWNSFASGSSGCCVEFDHNKLIGEIEKFKREKNSANNISCEKVKYKQIKDLQDIGTSGIEDLPFLKRYPFHPEQEFRIVMLSNDEQKETFDIPISLDVINKITIAYKMPESVFKSVKKCIEKIAPDFKGEINRSTLLKNDEWISFFENQISA
jgi:hypothetical protein